MQPTEIIPFGIAMFLALAALIKWKRRRDTIAARLNRGLRGYVEGRATAPAPAADKTHTQSFIAA